MLEFETVSVGLNMVINVGCFTFRVSTRLVSTEMTARNNDMQTRKFLVANKNYLHAIHRLTTNEIS
jgi:hypothetical protein